MDTSKTKKVTKPKVASMKASKSKKEQASSKDSETKASPPKKISKKMPTVKPIAKGTTLKNSSKKGTKIQKAGSNEYGNGSVFVTTVPRTGNSGITKNATNVDILNQIFNTSFNIDLEKFRVNGYDASSCVVNKNQTPMEFDIEKQYFFSNKTIFGKRLTCNTVPYKVKVSVVKGNNLLQRLVSYQIEDANIKLCKEFFVDNIASIDAETELIVKITDVAKWKNLMKCYKEAKIHQKLYKANGSDEYGNTIKGEDLVVKPYACCPIYYNGKWRMVFVQGRAQGKPLQDLIRTNALRNKNYPILNPIVSEACNKLWCLGFVHGDLHSQNILYDGEKVNFIDLESTIKIPEEIVGKYKKARQQVNNEVQKTNVGARATQFLDPYVILQDAARDIMTKVQNSIETLEDCTNATSINDLAYLAT